MQSALGFSCDVMISVCTLCVHAHSLALSPCVKIVNIAPWLCAARQINNGPIVEYRNTPLFSYTPLYCNTLCCLKNRKGCVCTPKAVVYVAQGILENMRCVQKLKQ